jgi:hypothetical protein
MVKKKSFMGAVLRSEVWTLTPPFEENHSCWHQNYVLRQVVGSKVLQGGDACPSMFSLVILDTREESKVATLIRIHKSIASF